MKSAKIIVIALIVPVMMAFAILFSRKPADVTLPDATLIAEVGDKKIFIKDLEREMAIHSDASLEKLDKKELLHKMIKRTSIFIRATELGLDKDPKIIRSYQNSLIGKLKQQEIEPRLQDINVTADEIETYFNENIDEFTEPVKVQLAMIFKKVPSTMHEEKRQACYDRMKMLITKVKEVPAEKGFGNLAISISDHQASRYKGGLIGWFTKNSQHSWPSSLIEAGIALKSVGEVSDIISAEDGIYLVRATNRQESSVTPIQEASAKIRHQLILKKRKEIEANFEKKALDSVAVTIYDDVINKMSLPPSKKGSKSKGPPSLLQASTGR